MRLNEVAEGGNGLRFNEAVFDHALFDDEDAFVHGYNSAEEYFDNYRTNLKKITLKKALEDFINYEK